MRSFEEKGERSKNLPYKENPWNGIIPDSKEKKTKFNQTCAFFYKTIPANLKSRSLENMKCVAVRVRVNDK